LGVKLFFFSVELVWSQLLGQKTKDTGFLFSL
jgi:hypothetical protein